MKDIKFIESHGFVGEDFSMTVDGKFHSLHPGHWKYEGKFGDHIDHIDHAIYILKTEYAIVKCREEIKFEWDGSM